MGCHNPIDAWPGATSPNGKRPLVFKRPGNLSKGLQISCGQCLGCRLEKGRQWALRCVHEASLHKENSFLTLTYDDSHYPSGGSLNLRDIQLFLKRLRKSIGPIRFFQVGEYGDKLQRPHHHALIFGYDFPDKVLYKKTPYGNLSVSPLLSRLWPHGFSTVGDFTPQSAAYVTRYALKKITGQKASEHYQGRKPEYVTMSRRPGIGRGWYDKWQKDVFPRDYAVQNGRKLKVPDYYTNLLAKSAPAMYDSIKQGRRLMGERFRKREAYLKTPIDSFRLKERGEVLAIRLNEQKRSYENDPQSLQRV